MTKLLHLANWNSTNIGNGALTFGTERVFREDIDPSMTFTPEPWDEYIIENARGPRAFDRTFVDLVNAHDGLLVGGAVTFNGRKPLTGAGMRFDLPLEFWPQIKKPVIFYGNSYRFWPGQPYHNVERLKEVVQHIIKTPSVFFGVRNDGTKPFLENLLGLASDKIVEVPDPGMYVPAEDHEYPELHADRTNVMISLNNEDEESRFPDAAKKHRFVRALAACMERLSGEFDLNYILCPHYFDDYKIMAELIDILPPKIVHQRTVSTGLLAVPKAPWFYGRYAKADVAMSMRIHSLSPSIGLGLSVVPLISQGRVSDFLEQIGIADLAVDVFADGVEEVLYAQTHHAIANAAAVRQRVRAAAALSRERTRQTNMAIKDLLSRHA